MAYIQSSTPLDDNKETTGTTGQLITPALNSSAGDASTTTNAATPKSTPNFIQPNAPTAQQGTGFTNIGTYLDKNQGASQQLTGALNTTLDTANNAAASAVNAANSQPTSGNMQTATSAVNNAISKSTLAQDIGGRTQLLRDMSPTTISNAGLGLNQFLVQQNFAAGKVPDYNLKTPGSSDATPIMNTEQKFTGTPAVIEKPQEPVKFSPTVRHKSQPIYGSENEVQLHNLAAARNNIAIFNPMAEVTPPGANYQAGWGVNQAANEDIARTTQANMQQPEQQSRRFNINQMQTTVPAGMYNVNAAMLQNDALARLAQTYK